MLGMKKKKYEIWVGWYHLGQGYHPPSEPELIDTVEATSFKIACVLHEHQISIDTLRMQMDRKESYIEDAHFGRWYYNPKTNSNSWTGRYFESKEEALEGFTK
jgi:hypothetical protein